MTRNENDAALEARAAQVKRCTLVGFGVNGLMSVLKIVAGIVGHSGAMIADGVHSISDFLTDIVVIACVGVSARGVDDEYRYGHGKFETFATFLIAEALVVVGVGLGWNGVKSVIAAFNGEQLAQPGLIALVMAVVSIVAKEMLFQYTNRVGKKLKSNAVIANAWHHRSDALSSVATLVGISGAFFLGQQWRILDPIAEILVSLFIVVVAVKLAVPAVKELLEVALPADENAKIAELINGIDQVKAYHHLRTRHNGNAHVIDVHIKVDPQLTVTQAHDVATALENRLKANLDRVIANVHVEPYKGESTDSHRHCSE